MCSAVGETKNVIFLPLPYISREPLAYAKDVFNYLDLSGYFLIAATFVFRYLGSDAQWILGSLAIIINFCGIFKYSVGDRYIGLYIKCLGMVIYKDIPRFLVVFTIILVAFSISFFTALKAGDFNLGSALGSEYSLCKEDVGCVMLAGLKTWLEGSSVVRSLSTAGWLGAILAIFFMLSVVIILLNVLIAQLSLTYEMVQEESLLSFSVLRMQSVATIEWQSRFKYWNLRKKYYVPGEIKSRQEVEEMMKQYQESTNPTSPRDDEKWHAEDAKQSQRFL